MDIKDLILIGGGMLLVAVIGHGFWLAWRGRRVGLRMDIEPNIPREDVDELVLLRAELPNGGARIRSAPQEQGSLDLSEDPPPSVPEPSFLPPGSTPAKRREPIVASRKTLPRREATSGNQAAARPIKTERSPSRLAGGSTAASRRVVAAAEPTRPPSARRELDAGDAGEAEVDTLKPATGSTSGPSDVIVINVLARNGAKFRGADVLEAFLRNGLKFGDMNIFHRVDPASKALKFSVASAIEPGTFDLSTMENFSTPGVSFFMRLPGPDEPLQVFDDMLTVSRDVAASLGADLKDEQLSVMTTQTIQHCRSRIEDFSRKRMSQRA
jgi:cell division protein ZipA